MDLQDESGAFGQTEFVRAYMELCMQVPFFTITANFTTILLVISLWKLLAVLQCQNVSDPSVDVIIMMSKTSAVRCQSYFHLIARWLQAGAAESAEGFKNAYENQRADAGFLFKLLLGLDLGPKALTILVSMALSLICVLKMVEMCYLQDFPVCWRFIIWLHFRKGWQGHQMLWRTRMQTKWGSLSTTLKLGLNMPCTGQGTVSELTLTLEPVL